jgi:hypothetical protein
VALLEEAIHTRKDEWHESASCNKKIAVGVRHFDISMFCLIAEKSWEQKSNKT